jgi:hypothetical protein
MKDIQRAYYIKNRDKVLANSSRYHKKKWAENASFRLISTIRRYVGFFVKGKRQRTEVLLGYTYKQLISHLGGPPKNGEHVDHIVPISWFIPGTPVSVIWALPNLQLLPATENIKKGNSFAHPITKEYYNHILPYLKEEYATYQFILK